MAQTDRILELLIAWAPKGTVAAKPSKTISTITNVTVKSADKKASTKADVRRVDNRARPSAAINSNCSTFLGQELRRII